MRTTSLNRASSVGLIVLSSIALLMVVTGYFQPPQTDEGAAAHIFQLSVVALAPVGLLFLGTVDWKQPRGALRPLIISGVVLFVAFAAPYYLEHYR